MKHELLTIEDLQQAKKAVTAEGLSEESLMEKAGEGIVDVIINCFPICHTLIFCGPGKNGGDGKVVARLLKKKGWPVDIIFFKDLPSFEKIQKALEKAELIVDGLLGTGLSHALEGDMRHLIEMINASLKPVVSIDIPSGIDTNSGTICGVAIRATETVTFWRARPGHYLLPGRDYTGHLHIKDIGIPDRLLPSHTYFLNSPSLWNDFIKEPSPSDHKYTRGACLIVGTGSMPGAVRLATRAARRVGAGLVRLMCKAEEYPIFATVAWGEVVTPIKKAKDFLEWTLDSRFHALLWGPGSLPKGSTREQALVLLASKKPCVLDGGALSSFEGKTQELQSHLHENVILTPHEGEFYRLFPHLAFLQNKAEKTRMAAIESGVVIVLKGYDTIIASPNGQIIINGNAPATLATAGTGDVLAGLMVGLLAQGISPFQAAATAVWIHGEAANRVGLGLIAEDLSDQVPAILKLLSVLKNSEKASLQ